VGDLFRIVIFVGLFCMVAMIFCCLVVSLVVWGVYIGVLISACRCYWWWVVSLLVVFLLSWVCVLLVYNSVL